MKQTIYEEIQRMKLLSRYDKSKTLSEQVKILSEADKVFPPEVQIPWDFYDIAAEGGGTNPDGMLDALNKINSAELFWKVNDGVIKNSGGMNIADVINDELENNIGQLDYVKKFQAKLKTLGITSTFTEYTNGWEPGTFKITTPAGKSDLVQAAATGLPEWTKTFDCLKDVGTLAVTSDNPKVIYVKMSGDTLFFYEDKSVIYVITANKQQLKGTFNCVNGALLITTDKSQWTKDGNWQSIQTLKGAKVTANKKKTAATTIPPELGNAEGVKKFQQWLDDNHSDDDEGKGKGWASGYVSGKIEQGKNGGGYGTYGPRTKKAWENTAYKDAYIKSLQTPAAQPAAQPATTATEGPKGASYTDEKTGGFYKWNGTEYEFQQSYLASDDIVYTWDGTRYVGAQ